jgi:CheY-like chemotaxis protein
MIRLNAMERALSILVVDDQADVLRAMNRLLTSLGYEVQSAVCVQDALELARSNPFDLLISDLGLPDGTGLDLMRQVNLLRPTKGIAVSGRGEPRDVRDCEDAGFTAHLTKPTDLPRLLATIQQVAEHQ